MNATIPLHASGLALEDLYEHGGLQRLDALFLERLARAEPALHADLLRGRGTPESLAPKQESALLLALAPQVDAFIGWLFGIENEVRALAARHHELNPLYGVKRNFVQRKAMHKIKPDEAERIDGAAIAALLEALIGEPLTELVFARHVVRWQEDEAANAESLELALQYAAWAALSAAGRERHRAGVLFKAPHKLDSQHLVPAVAETTDGYTTHRYPAEKLRRREGFKLTDRGTDLTGALDQAHYCIWCHEQGKDSCSKGLKEKPKSADEAPSFKKSQLGVLFWNPSDTAGANAIITHITKNRPCR